MFYLNSQDVETFNSYSEALDRAIRLYVSHDISSEIYEDNRLVANVDSDIIYTFDEDGTCDFNPIEYVYDDDYKEELK